MIPVPANLQPYHAVLGEELTIAFLLEFGGADLYMPKSPGPNTPLARLVGQEKAAQLAGLDQLPARVPLGKVWIARVWRDRGLSIAAIARKLHTSDVTIRNWLAKSNGDRRKTPADHFDQLKLF